ncbi:hypothetical protein ALC57_05842 [Trachymyrmex cornetzi]|uniref:Integrase catalytic domain-containing protein n=1 Tax=Trachymyrmex cornetzi TaxID=471704 RepID=A0A151JA06_9HYME|nr:hypothetical protein ALC57_05842 [Trachymyrmex cornetzi]
MSLESTTLWCDSTVVLGWICAQPNLLAVFESNRVARIQELTEGKEWRHVSTGDNPADWLSRGANPSELKRADIWWNGPDFLANPPEDWSEMPHIEPLTQKNRPVFLVKTVESNVIDLLFARRSKLHKIVRIFAYCRRFIQHLKKGNRSGGDISAEEYYSSLVELVKYSQGDSFNAEIESLARGMPITKGSLASWTPFLDEDGILRVRGRLKNWLFTSNSKCYVCVFVCFSTKALHLEFVSNLIKEAFIATLRRFVSRRGKSSHVYSDNGTSFVGGNNELVELGRPLEINRLILVKEDNLPPSKWKLG